MDNFGTMFLVISLGDRILLKYAGGTEGRATLPGRNFTVIGGDNFNLKVRWGEATDLRLQSISNACIHGVTAGENDVLT